jgi:hypothetical protein
MNCSWIRRGPLLPISRNDEGPPDRSGGPVFRCFVSDAWTASVADQARAAFFASLSFPGAGCERSCWATMYPEPPLTPWPGQVAAPSM